MLATAAGIIVCSYCYDDVLHRSHPLTLTYAWFGLPYFLYDTISMFYVSTITDLKPKESYLKKFSRFVLKSPVIVIHHILLAPVGFTLLLVSKLLLHKPFPHFKNVCMLCYEIWNAPSSLPIFYVKKTNIFLSPKQFFRDGLRNGDFFMGTVYLMEASTPFVCMRFILSKFKVKIRKKYTNIYLSPK